MTTTDIAICVGHSRPGDSGAVSTGGTSEWDYNSQLAPMIDCRLHAFGWSAIVIDQYQGSNYSDAMTWLAAELRERDVRAAVELHFNAAGAAARGHEWLYWHTSTNGSALADALDDAFRAHVSGLTARGTRARTAGQRGTAFLRLTPCPAVIGEPFFGSNADDWAVAENQDRIAQAYANGIHSWLSGMSVEPGRPQAASCG